MYNIQITMNAGIPCVSSLQVAEDFGKKHKHVLEAIGNIKAENSAVTPMFIESTYQAGTGKSYKCYDITRDGFSLLVMGFTGKEALDWKLRYIDAFNKMEHRIKHQYDEIQRLEMQAKADRAAAMRMNAENRRMKMLLDHPEMQNLSTAALETLGIKRMEEATGQNLGHALPQAEKTYSATEAGKMLGGISAMKIGQTANKHGLKTEEYGIFVLDKSRYSAKEVTSFRYNRQGIKKLAELLGVAMCEAM